jgi:hypothetical protein
LGLVGVDGRKGGAAVQAVFVQESVPIIEAGPKAFQPMSSVLERAHVLTDRFCPQSAPVYQAAVGCDVP